MRDFKIARTALLATLPIVLYFSYWPNTVLAALSTMNLELSLAEIWLAVFALLSIPSAIATVKKLGLVKSLLLLAFPIYLTITCSWSASPLRGLITAAIIWCIVVIIFSIPRLIKILDRRTLSDIFVAASIFIAFFCWAQCILDLLGVPRDITLLCQGCTYRSFGFPHPNGFAIEPQFMGNLLLAPTFYCLYRWYKKPSGPSTAILLLMASTLFLTFSRGAIYAFIVAYVVIITTLAIKYRKATPLSSLPLILIAFFVTVLMQGIMAQLSPTTDTFSTGVSKVVSQLTLGKVNLRPQLDGISGLEKSLPTNNTAQVATFDGYVEESTTTRLDLSKAALKAWSSTPKTITVGTGLGSAGHAMYEVDPTLGNAKEIVQNEYISILLETGILGYLALAITVFTALKLLKPKFNAETIFILGLILAYAITLCFFSGLPNALHIYILPPLAILLASDLKPKKRRLPSPVLSGRN